MKVTINKKAWGAQMITTLGNTTIRDDIMTKEDAERTLKSLLKAAMDLAPCFDIDTEAIALDLIIWHPITKVSDDPIKE